MRSRRKTGPFFVTTSWDDGHPSDRRLADLLAKYNVPATFYVPCRNREGRPVMRDADIRNLAKTFEIAGHTRDHVVLTDCDEDEAAAQIHDNRHRLSDVIGRSVEGFAYVRGRHDEDVCGVVRRAGFSYARTTVNFECRLGPDVWRMPATLQFFPHSTRTKLRNLVRRGLTRDRIEIMAASARSASLAESCFDAARMCQARGELFHLWGHSWELDEFELWDELATFFAMLSDLDAQRVDNASLVRALAPAGPDRPALYAATELTGDA